MFKPQRTPSGSNRFVTPGVAICVSGFVHFTVLAVLGLIVFAQPAANDANEIELDFTIAETRDLTSEVLEPVAMSFDTSGSKGLLTSDDEHILSQSETSDREMTLRIAEAVPLEFARSEFASGSLAENVGAYSATSEIAQGSGGDGTAGRNSGEGQFFGLSLQGKSVVFVVDASKSMNHPFSGPAKTRFGRVKIELVNTIRKMQESEQFFIIFFNRASIPMPATGLTAATPGNQRAYLNWMVNIPADGRTKPAMALMQALQLRPEVIYFLTDGRFDYQVVEQVSAANQRRVTINTIGFGNDDGEQFLRMLAEQNGGVYRFFPDSTATTASKP